MSKEKKASAPSSAFKKVRVLKSELWNIDGKHRHVNASEEIVMGARYAHEMESVGAAEIIDHNCEVPKVNQEPLNPAREDKVIKPKETKDDGDGDKNPEKKELPEDLENFLAKMKKPEDIVKWAKENLDLELDPKAKKADLVNAVLEHVTKDDGDGGNGDEDTGE